MLIMPEPVFVALRTSVPPPFFVHAVEPHARPQFNVIELFV